MKKLTQGQLREALTAAEEKLVKDPHNEVLRHTVEKLREGLAHTRKEEPNARARGIR